ncbi:ABC transporter [Longimonas halophila]|uniref:ABC transporter n=1 Tax=Longimonas halophila TaxID=1469170 RepID=A0A2H3P9K0_9BACT|nr:ABC transporter ATP-binding protein [Longimonas halophila]PEN09605.1 ABC transporter [Longimonas halophila]
MTPVLETRSATVVRGGDRILDAVSMAVEPGEWLGVIGPNGSGKTSLVRVLSGTWTPDAGSVWLHGEALSSYAHRERARQIAVVKQAPHVAFDLTVRELVMLGRAPYRGWMQSFTGGDQDRVVAALKAMNIAHLADRAVPSLSGGERQRAFLAQALVQEPTAWLLDEPTAHLDIQYCFSFFQHLKQRQSPNEAVIAVVHDLEQAARFADRLLLLDHGSVVTSGLPREVLTTEHLAHVFGVDATPESTPHGLRLQVHGPFVSS